jgi:hypothetical protein
VPQGSCLAPFLYIIFVNDLPVTEKCTVSLFADDTMFLSTNKNANIAVIQLQRQLNTAINGFRQWRLRVNATKTVAVLYSTKSLTKVRQLTINNINITWSQHAKYLGLTIDRHLNFKEHTSNIIKKQHGLETYFSRSSTEEAQSHKVQN